MSKKALPFCLLAVTLFLLVVSPLFALDLDRLSPVDQAHLSAILARLEESIALKKKDGSANLLTFSELYSFLPREDHGVLNEIRSLNPGSLGATAHTFPEEANVEFVKFEKQQIWRDGRLEELGPQFLPDDVARAYEAMMRKMEKDLGKRQKGRAFFDNVSYFR